MDVPGLVTLELLGVRHKNGYLGELRVRERKNIFSDAMFRNIASGLRVGPIKDIIAKSAEKWENIGFQSPS